MSSPTPPPLIRAALGEFIATAFLLVAVVGSGIAAERLSSGNVALALTVNALATSGALFMLIPTFWGVSGTHMNPVVTLAAAMLGQFSKSRVPVYLLMQVSGALAGTWVAHLMFELPIVQVGAHVRTGVGAWCGEVVATFGLLLAIFRCLTFGPAVVAGVVAAYIGGAYWFTSSTSFANPAVTIARSFTDTFAGIRIEDAPAFIVAQVAAMVIAASYLRWIRD